jgi:hypothetical protein
MKKNLITSLAIAAMTVVTLGGIEVGYAEHQPRPNLADDKIDQQTDDVCGGAIRGNSYNDHACDGLKKANNAATK